MAIIVGDNAIKLNSSGSTNLGDSLDDNHFITGSIYTTGSITVKGQGISGSHTHLSDGTSYLIAGSNVTVTTGSTGAVTIASSGGGGGGGLSFDGSTANGVLTYKDSDEATVESSLTFDGSSILTMPEYLSHNGDSDTYIRFTTDDINIQAGGVDFIKITEDDSQDLIEFNVAEADVDFIVNNTNDEVLRIDTTGVIFNDDSHNDIDFRIETASEDEAFFIDGSADTIYINKGKSSVTTVIKNTNEEAIRVGAAGIIFNEYSHASMDFRVESDNNTHMLFVDAGSDKVGINDSGPISELSVAGKISITSESSTPSAPADGHGWLYTKTDGKVYWQSNDVSETDLTAGGSSESSVSYSLVYGTVTGTTGNVSDELTVPADKTITAITVDITAAFVDGSSNGTYAKLYFQVTDADDRDIILFPQGAYVAWGSLSEGTAFWGYVDTHGAATARVTVGTSDTNVALYWSGNSSGVAAGAATIKVWYV